MDLGPLEQLAAGRGARGRRDLFDRVWTIFRTDVHQTLEEVIVATGRKDARALKRSAHALKGIAGSAGATRLMELAARVEQAARDADFALGLRLLFQLRAELPCTLQALESALRAPPAE